MKDFAVGVPLAKEPMLFIFGNSSKLWYCASRCKVCAQLAASGGLHVGQSIEAAIMMNDGRKLGSGGFVRGVEVNDRY